jgi:DNA-binding GntR family transcriptional regulator
MEKKFEIDKINVTPLRESIANAIRGSIIKGKLQPGERLMEPIIAEQIGVSRTPVREAFLQLESEGLVEVLPRKGAVVSDISVKNAEELYVVRSVLEGLAARLSSEKITDELLDKLKNINKKLTELAKEKSDNFIDITNLNNEFHSIITRSACNNKLYQSIEILRKQTTRYNFISLSVLSRLKVSVKEHEEIINFLSKRDTEESEKFMRKHIENAGKELCEYIKKKTNETEK